ncbi:MAG: sterol desaturase family protein [Myxococcota bacterium]|nr:sterol desaturase family protein [Myxococcales bacterium]
MSEFVDALSFAELLGFVALVLGGLVAVSLAFGFAAERVLGPRRRIFDVPLREGQLFREAVGNARFVALAVPAFAAMLHFAPHAPSDAPRFALTFFVCWLAFEVLYWMLHRAMHTRAGYRFHRYHHDSRVTTPLTGYSMSTVEALGWLVALVGPPLLLSFVVPLSIEGWLAYLAYHVSGNVVGHSNAEVLGAPVARRPLSWIAHPITYHALHHARFDNHYGFGSTFMDRSLRTEWSDWPALHARVLDGRAMTKLSERG